MDKRAPPTGGGGQHASKRQKTNAALATPAALPLSRNNTVPGVVKPVINLAPSGDVILVFSDHSRLRVYSGVLKLASPVFKAMFGPHFSEGRNLSEANPKSVPLPGDTPEAMTRVCEMLHHHNRSGPAPKGMLLRAIVSLVDKYDLVAAIGLQIRSFLEEQFEEAKRSRFRGNFDEELLAMSYMLKDEKLFSLISRELIVFHGRSFGTLNDPFGILPSRVLVALEERRNAAREDLDSIITKTLTSWFQSFDTMSQRCKRPHNDCAMGLLISFLANKHDIRNRDREDYVSHQFDYWMDPDRENREFSQYTFADLYYNLISGYVCSRCYTDTQIKQVLCLSLHLAAEAGYNKIPGLHLGSFRN